MKSTLSSLRVRKLSRREEAFTLVELLTVIAIIVLLVGITMGTLGFATRKASEQKAKGQMALIASGLARYEKDFGEYPEPVDNSGEGDSGSRCLYQALTGDGSNYIVIASGEGTVPSDGDIGTDGEVYVEGIDPKANKHGMVNTSLALVDPFGQLWRYRVAEDDPSNPTKNKGTYDLWSYGTDRHKENEAKWIKNW